MTEDFTAEALAIREHLKSFENQISIRATGHKILILGDYGYNLSLLETLKSNIIGGGYSAFLVKDLKQGIAVSDFDAASILTGHCDLILLIDGESIGTGVECSLIMNSKELQEKTLFLTSKNFDAMCDIRNPYFYYPIYDYHDTTQTDIINKALGMVKRESYRRAKIYIAEQKKKA